MTYEVVLLRRAREDVNSIFAWLAERSSAGAARWYDAFHDAAMSLRATATQHAQAPEAANLGYDIRQRFFRTPRGRVYRLLYLLVDDEVRILRVRGPGQAPVQLADLPIVDE